MDVILPESIKIGPCVYRVTVEDKPFVSDDQRDVLSGEVDHNALAIRIMRRAPVGMFVTFWHEVLHGIDDMAGTGLSEETVSRLAPILAGVLIDNGYAVAPATATESEVGA